MFGLKNRAAESRAIVQRPALESLEPRRLMTATATLDASGQVQFVGDDGPGRMEVRQPDSSIRFYYSTDPAGMNPPVAPVNFIPASQITNGIRIDAKGGADYVLIGGSVPGTKTCYVYGGAGNDTLMGGPGGDVLMGGDDADTIRGNAGPDLEIGGAGVDDIAGEDNQDIIFANSTTHESSTVNLGKILAEWKRNDITTNARIGHILGGGGLNGNVVFDSTTVINDNVADQLAGSDDTDWFVCGVTDHCNDILSGEVRTNF
jgi:hypothetical protein